MHITNFLAQITAPKCYEDSELVFSFYGAGMNTFFWLICNIIIAIQACAKDVYNGKLRHRLATFEGEHGF